MVKLIKYMHKSGELNLFVAGVSFGVFIYVTLIGVGIFATLINLFAFGFNFMIYLEKKTEPSNVE